MQIAVKKIYCPSCRKLVKAREQFSKTEKQILCSKCSRSLYTWTGLRWNFSGQPSA
ncbi:MAG: hypothetical protein NT082_02300 [Chloroflexi bacterium]|nr:hypothetical protein [Chloroflexota bacterium]